MSVFGTGRLQIVCLAGGRHPNSLNITISRQRLNNLVTFQYSLNIFKQTAAEIWLFFDFQDGGRRHLGFVKF